MDVKKNLSSVLKTTLTLQESKFTNMRVLVGKKAPDFKAKAIVNGEIVEDFTLSQYEGKKYVVLFFYPLDFTFVCPTEIIAFQDHLEEFHKLDTEVIGVSVDSIYCHWAWLNTPREKGGIEGVTYPLVSDLSKAISYNYGVLAGDYTFDIDEEGNEVMRFEGEPVAYRGLFLIDKQGIVRHQVINDLSLGRSVKEAIRMVKALQHVEKYDEVCPAEWEEGKEALKPTMESVAEYLAKHS